MNIKMDELKTLIEFVSEQTKKAHSDGRASAMLYQPTIAPFNPHTLRTLLDTTNKIEAIKAVRELTGWGLKESKDWCEANHPIFRAAP